MTEEEQQQFNTLTKENEQLREDLRLANDGRDVALANFEKQQRMHEAGMARVKELSQKHLDDHETIRGHVRKIEQLNGRLSKLPPENTDDKSAVVDPA